MAFEAMAASKQPQRSYDLSFEISNLEYPGIHVHIASNGLRGHGGLRGHSGLQTTSEVTFDLKIQLSDLDYLMVASEAANGHLIVMN